MLRSATASESGGLYPNSDTEVLILRRDGTVEFDWNAVNEDTSELPSRPLNWRYTKEDLDRLLANEPLIDVVGDELK